MHEWGLPSGATQQAQALHLSWVVFTIAGICVGVIVYALIFIPLVLWRHKENDELPPQFKKNTALELTYTAIPLLIVVGLFVLTYRVESMVERLTPKPAAIVNVTAFQWSWRFQYPGTPIDVIGTPQNPPTLVLPLGETVRINLTSTDVDHSFWIPAFLFKRDAIPGLANHFDLRPTRAGVYKGVCAQFCGLDHTHMTFLVRVIPQSAFRRWEQTR